MALHAFMIAGTKRSRAAAIALEAFPMGGAEMTWAAMTLHAFVVAEAERTRAGAERMHERAIAVEAAVAFRPEVSWAAMALHAFVIAGAGQTVMTAGTELSGSAMITAETFGATSFKTFALPGAEMLRAFFVVPEAVMSAGTKRRRTLMRSIRRIAVGVRGLL